MHPQEHFLEQRHEDRLDLRLITKNHTLTLLRDRADANMPTTYIRGPKDILVTGRSVVEYEHIFPGFTLDPEKRYVDVGAGLSEAMPMLAVAGGGQRPTIIDPADYATIETVLLEALRRADFDDVHPLLAERRVLLAQWLERCRIITDPAHVRLLPMLLSEAMQAHPEIEASGDVVIDCFGPLQYHQTEFPGVVLADTIRRKIDAIRVLEKRLVAPKGTWYVAER